MSERNDRKLVQVPVASYSYRHEAEFAAGFLKDAGIPYRLQIEDPTLGLSATNAATLWVTAIDEQRARAVLEQDLALEPGDDALWRASGDDAGGEEDVAGTVDVAVDGTGHRPPRQRGGAERGAGVAAGRPGGNDPAEAAVDRHGNVKPNLTLRQRVVSLLGSVGLSSTLTIDAVRNAHEAVTWVVAICATLLALVAVFGRAPGPLKGLLSSLSGDAP